MCFAPLSLFYMSSLHNDKLHFFVKIIYKEFKTILLYIIYVNERSIYYVIRKFRKNVKTFRQWLLFIGVACSFAGTVGIGYFFTYYYQLGLEAFSFTDAQLGAIISAFSSCIVICYLLDGYLADKVPSHLLIHIDNIGGSLLAIAICAIPRYPTMRIIYLLLGVVGVVFTAGSWMKVLVRVGTRDQEGRIFGYYYMLIGVVSIITGLSRPQLLLLHYQLRDFVQ